MGSSLVPRQAVDIASHGPTEWLKMMRILSTGTQGDAFASIARYERRLLSTERPNFHSHLDRKYQDGRAELLASAFKDAVAVRGPRFALVLAVTPERAFLDSGYHIFEQA